MASWFETTLTITASRAGCHCRPWSTVAANVRSNSFSILGRSPSQIVSWPRSMSSQCSLSGCKLQETDVHLREQFAAQPRQPWAVRCNDGLCRTDEDRVHVPTRHSDWLQSPEHKAHKFGPQLV